jgi:hypothetical protein
MELFFFDTKKSLPDQIFCKPNNLFFYFYNSDVALCNPNMFFKHIKKFLIEIKSEFIFIYSLEDDEIIHKQQFTIAQITDNFYSLLCLNQDENKDILTFSNKVFVTDETQSWGLIFDNSTELLLIGVNINQLEIFKNLFIGNAFFELSR